ncbi:MAG: class I SAM-dependent methyltransferase [Acidimicrobiales bacterium]
MARRLPHNLEMLRSAFDPKRIGDILPGDTFELDGIEFVCAYQPESTATRFFIVKSPALVDRYLDLCRRFEGARIVELGIAEGGSTALMALAARPAALVAVDLEEQRLEALDEFVAARGLGGQVLAHYGVDQADRATLGRLVDEDLGGEPIDLVVDDCSHVLGPTRSSFETLFPRLRPGGLYVIEDWNADHLMRVAVADAVRAELEAGDESLRTAIRESLANAAEPEARREPLSQLALEFVLARAQSGDVIDEVVVDEFWITVRRGPGELDPDGFRLDDAYTDYFGLKGW